MKSSSKPKNSIILMLGSVGASPADHNVREFHIKIYNTIDMLPHQQGEYTDENTKGYMESEDLEATLDVLRANIKTCCHIEGVTETILEEDIV